MLEMKWEKKIKNSQIKRRKKLQNKLHLFIWELTSLPITSSLVIFPTIGHALYLEIKKRQQIKRNEY